MGSNPRKSSSLRRYGLAAVGVVATAGGVAGNLGSIMDLFDKFFGSKDSKTEVAPVQVAGSWQADITYDWGLKRTEVFDLKMDGNKITGTVSFLGVKRAILEGSISGDSLSITTQSQETAGDSDPKMAKHQYTGKASEKEIHFEMLTSGGYTEHTPVEFVATKIP